MDNQKPPTVFLIEDDRMTRVGLQSVCENAGYQVEAFEAAEPFLEAAPYDRPCCAVIDIRLQGGITGLALQSELKRRGIDIPIIIVTGYADVRTAVDCMRTGAMTLLEKPVSDRDLLQSVSEAIERDSFRRLLSKHVRTLESSLKQLTGREKEVLASLLAGKLNKQIAQELDVSQRTIEVDRSRILKKFDANNAAELAVKATELKMLSGFSYRFDSSDTDPDHAMAMPTHLRSQMN